MCLIAFAWQAHPRWQWVLVANRDEFHARPSAALARWDDAPAVLAGRDLSSGGSWLGVADGGRLAAVTNVRLPEAPDPTLHSRGMLVSHYLQGRVGALESASALQAGLPGYGPCNLLLVDAEVAVYTSNQGPQTLRVLPPGVYGLSNAQLETPWPKTLALKASLSHWLASRDDRIEPLFAALADETRPADAALPDTGVGLERERFVSPAFIRSAYYGTRCSTVLRVDAAGQGEAIERRFAADGRPAGETRARFHWPARSTA